MSPFAITRHLVAALVALGFFAAVPASAAIQKFIKQCDGKLCPFFRALIQTPDGWAENKEASDYLGVVMLLPKGLEFEKAPAKIYAAVRYNPDKKPISDFISDNIGNWKGLAKDAKVTQIADLKRGTKSSFVRYAFEAPSLAEQGYELQAVTIDRDGYGNQFVVTIVLTANTQAALKAAEPAYLGILQKF